MVFEKDSVERMQIGMYGDMMKGALKNKGVIFILLLFLALAAISFAFGYSMGFNSIPPVEATPCLINPF